MEAGTQFIGVKPEINMAERKSNVANNPTDVFTIEEIRGFIRSYVGFIDTVTVTVSDENLIEGNQYIIQENSGSGDFTNVGAADNNDGTVFTATGTTPTDWGTPAATLISVNESSFLLTEVSNSLGITPNIQLDLISNYPDKITGFNLIGVQYDNFITNLPSYASGYVYAVNGSPYDVSIISKNDLVKQPIQLTLY